MRRTKSNGGSPVAMMNEFMSQWQQRAPQQPEPTNCTRAAHTRTGEATGIATGQSRAKQQMSSPEPEASTAAHNRHQHNEWQQTKSAATGKGRNTKRFRQRFTTLVSGVQEQQSQRRQQKSCDGCAYTASSQP